MSRLLTRVVPVLTTPLVRAAAARLHPGVLPQPPRRHRPAPSGRPARPAVRPVRPGRAVPAGDLAGVVRPRQGAARGRRGHRRRPDRRVPRCADHPARGRHARCGRARAAAPVRPRPDPAQRRHHRGPPGPRRHAGQRRRDDDRTGRRVRGQHEVAQHGPAGQRGGPGSPGPQPDPDSEFEKAIKKAEEKQKELDKILDKAAKGVKGVFGVLSSAARPVRRGRPGHQHRRVRHDPGQDGEGDEGLRGGRDHHRQGDREARRHHVRPDPARRRHRLQRRHGRRRDRAVRVCSASPSRRPR